MHSITEPSRSNLLRHLVDLKLPPRIIHRAGLLGNPRDCIGFPSRLRHYLHFIKKRPELLVVLLLHHLSGAGHAHEFSIDALWVQKRAIGMLTVACAGFCLSGYDFVATLEKMIECAERTGISEMLGDVVRVV